MEIQRMKKSLFAMAAVTAFAGAAQAQSSVTVYGILDVGFNSLTMRNAGGTNTAGVTKSNTTSFGGNGSETTSRLGFKGTEDLGGGTSAFFTVEVAITPNSAQNFSTGGTANRQTLVGLKKNGIGAASIGTQYTPVHLAVGATDVGQQNNVAGNVIYPNAGTTNRDILTTTNTADGGTFGYVVRSNNSAFFQSDAFAGFRANAFYTRNNSNTNQTTPASGGVSGSFSGGGTNAAGWGLGADYTWNKLYVAGAYQAFQADSGWGAKSYSATTASGGVSSQSASAGAPVAWGIGGASAAGTNTKDVNGYAAAVYDFGILKAYAQYVNRKVTSVINANEYLSRSAQQLGVRSYITPTIEAWASVGNGRIQAYGTAAPTANFTGYQLGSNYYLSKRTNLYGIYGSTGTSNVTSNGNNTNPVSSNYNMYAVGLRHTF